MATNMGRLTQVHWDLLRTVHPEGARWGCFSTGFYLPLVKEAGGLLAGPG